MHDMKMSTASSMDKHMHMTTKDPMSGMDMGGMKMYFHTGFEDHILFENWTAQSNGAIFGWCALFFALALAYELLKYYRQIHLATASVVKLTVNAENGTTNNSSGTQDSQNDSCQTSSGDRYDRPLHTESRVRRQSIPIISTAHIFQTVLHMIQIFVSYILMLAFMLFNVWICLAVILGAGVGYFLVGSRRLTAYSTFDDDHCH